MRTVNELFRLDERVAIVTGGAGHIGLAFGEALSEQGARVVVVDRQRLACEERAHVLETKSGVKALALPEDLSDSAAPGRVVAATLAAFGRIDVIVNNAAFTGASGLPGYAVPFPEQSLEAWEAAIRVNLTCAFQLVQAAHEELAARRGSVVNVGSIYGVVGPNMNLYAGTPMGNPAAYAATKGGLLQLTQYLATVLAPKVRVNAISPGGISRGQPEAFAERYAALTPLKRMGTEEDLKGALALLVSDAGAYITGQNIMVDGGWTAW
ncbi:MAG: short-chain dehydrogenase [Myxococcales bacterium 68-20]|nr:MAG: short-chain dehydrogenase [Myxococcales bacterium 68-20]